LPIIVVDIDMCDVARALFSVSYATSREDGEQSESRDWMETTISPSSARMKVFKVTLYSCEVPEVGSYIAHHNNELVSNKTEAVATQDKV